MQKPTEEQIRNALHDADDAFWAQIVKHFPEVEFGDFSPWDSLVWEQAQQRALEIWLYWNHPAHQAEREEA